MPEISCNAPHIEQAFANVLRNAVQALGADGRITISGMADTADVEIVIADTGEGIPEDNLSKVFDPFFTTRPVGQGVGLGLTTALNIIRVHNGTITAASKPSEQTAFTIKLPIHTESAS